MLEKARKSINFYYLSISFTFCPTQRVASKVKTKLAQQQTAFFFSIVSINFLVKSGGGFSLSSPRVEYIFRNLWLQISR